MRCSQPFFLGIVLRMPCRRRASPAEARPLPRRYIGGLVSLGAAMYVWRHLEEGPRKAATQRVPLALLGPRSLGLFSPLVSRQEGVATWGTRGEVEGGLEAQVGAWCSVEEWCLVSEGVSSRSFEALH